MIEIPGYTVLRLLGHGGMATVYLAQQQSLRREVALKILTPALASDPVATERFLREARVSAKLHHPNIVAIFDVGVHEGVPYMSIAYEPGGTVAGYTQARNDPKVALRIIRDIANALDYAHRQGVIHRDVKPENILLRNDGTCVLSDFGIAHAIEGSQTGLTREGTSVGTPHYMSPEQLRGEHVDARADIYSLGVVLFQLLVGELPYQGTDGWAIGMQHIASPIPHLPAHLDYLQTFLDALLAKDPTRRLQSGAEVVQWVDARLSGSGPALTVAMPSSMPSYAAMTPPGARGAASLAILPFADLSQTKDQEYLADGLTEELLNLLAKTPGLFVASRSSAQRFKGSTAKLAEIGRELKVATVLEGSVRKFGDRIRISVQLINVADGFQRWSDTYDRTMTDVFAIQDEIAALVVAALKEQLLPNADAEAAKKLAQAADDKAAAEARERDAAELKQREEAEKLAAEERRQKEIGERILAKKREREEAERLAAEKKQREEEERAAEAVRQREEEARRKETEAREAEERKQHEAAERVAAEKREREAAAQAAAAAAAAAAAERAAAERAEAERLAAEQRKREDEARAAAEARQREQEAREAAERRQREDTELAEARRQKEQAEERAAKERAEADRAAKERAEADRAAKERAEAERAAKDRAEAERAASERAEAERAASERAARERAAAERAAAEAAAAERAAQEARSRETSKIAALDADVAVPAAAAAATDAGPAEPERDPAREFASAYMAKPASGAPPPSATPRPASPPSAFTPARLGIAVAALLVLGVGGWLVWQNIQQKNQVACQAALLQGQGAADAGEFDKASESALAAHGVCSGDSETIVASLDARIASGKQLALTCGGATTKARELLRGGHPKAAGDAMNAVRAECAAFPGFPELESMPATAQAQALVLVREAEAHLKAGAPEKAQPLAEQAFAMDADAVGLAELRTQLAKRLGTAPPPVAAPVAPAPVAPTPTPTPAPAKPATTDPAATAAAAAAAKKAAEDRTRKLAEDKARKDAADKARAAAAAAAASKSTAPPPAPTAVLPVAPAPTPPSAPSSGRGNALVAASTPQPPYPPQALRAKVSGEVTVAFVVNTDGSVGRVRIVSAKPRGVFDRGVMNAVGRWRFQPIDEPQNVQRTITFQP